MTDETKPPKAGDLLAEFSLNRIRERAAARPPVNGPPLPWPVRWREEGTEPPIFCGHCLIRPKRLSALSDTATSPATD